MPNKIKPFERSIWPYIFLGPQIIISIVFFIWPAGKAIEQSLQRGDAFELHHRFVWLHNFTYLFHNNDYRHALFITLFFSMAVTLITMASALFFSTLVHHVNSGSKIYKTLLIWPYAIAPAVAGILWRFIFSPSVGIASYWFQKLGYDWNYLLHANQAFGLVIAAACWQQFSYNFLFFLVGLRSIPQNLIDAAALDGAGPVRRFKDIIFPLLSPITFFLLVINLIYAFFETFGVIQVMTEGGPGQATNILVYKVYHDGFIGLDLGGSAAQSVVLMGIVIILTFFQFRYVDKKVHY